MFFRLPRLTPGYIRYLQNQGVQNQRAGDPAMPRLAVLMGALGIGLCGYSSRQLATHHRPSVRILQWMDGPATGTGSLAAQARAHHATPLSQRPGLAHDLQPFALPKVP